MAEEAVDKMTELQEGLNPARAAGESYEDYRARRNAANKILKLRLRSGHSYHHEMKYTKAPGSEIEKGVPYVKGEKQDV
jgi:hypothetical protein